MFPRTRAAAKRDGGTPEGHRDTKGESTERQDTAQSFFAQAYLRGTVANLVRLPIKGIATRIIIR